MSVYVHIYTYSYMIAKVRIIIAIVKMHLINILFPNQNKLNFRFYFGRDTKNI